ncbi:MAG: hypothetical protein HOP23_11575 [Methylococcaceae bacterium]|nr:hypothetical protein [Methylococcaceae bacterium]
MASYKSQLIGLILIILSGTAFAQPNDLEIHYINVGQGGSTLIIGPNGTKILYDFGRVSGRINIVPYLKEQLKLSPVKGIDYAIISHGDKDHYMGYRDLVVKEVGGFDILKANYEPGTSKHSVTLEKYLFGPAKETSAGAFKPISLGFRIDLGNGAQAIVMAANGYVLGDEIPPLNSADQRNKKRMNENDRSIALFIEYGKFQYILDGDLGSGPERCSQHDTNQRDIQTKVAQRLLDLGFMKKNQGVDMLHVAHHGSESSTSWAYYQLVKPEVAIISVGPDQGSFLHPRVDVVEGVLTCKTSDGLFREDACSEKQGGDTRAECFSLAERAPSLKALYQTDYGTPGTSSTGSTSFQGFVSGDIQIKTDGETGYSVHWTGRTIPSQQADFHNPVIPDQRSFQFDEDQR